MIGPLAWLLMREPLKRNVIGGTLVGFAGALFIVNTETQLLSGDVNGPVLGYLAPILASLCHALSVVLLRFRSQSEDPVVMAFFANTLPALYVLPVFFLMDAQPTFELFGGYILSAFFWGELLVSNDNRLRARSCGKTRAHDIHPANMVRHYRPDLFWRIYREFQCGSVPPLSWPLASS